MLQSPGPSQLFLYSAQVEFEGGGGNDAADHQDGRHIIVTMSRRTEYKCLPGPYRSHQKNRTDYKGDEVESHFSDPQFVVMHDNWLFGVFSECLSVSVDNLSGHR